MGKIARSIKRIAAQIVTGEKKDAIARKRKKTRRRVCVCEREREDARAKIP